MRPGPQNNTLTRCRAVRDLIIFNNREPILLEEGGGTPSTATNIAFVLSSISEEGDVEIGQADWPSITRLVLL